MTCISSDVYTICQSPEVGRYLVAARDIDEGETICFEKPLVIGPKQATAAVCLSCYHRVDGSYVCSRCGWPLCDERCQHSDDHQAECDLFVSRKLKVFVDLEQGDDCRVYDCITPLRCLLNEDTDGDVSRLEDHNAHRKAVGLWEVDRISVVHVLRDQWRLADLFTAAQIQSVCGKLEVNAFEVDVEGAEARAVYSVACLMAHDCVPNTFCSMDPQNRMRVTAAVPIPKGEMITTSYTFSLDNTQQRRKHLRETKFFDCQCQRCRDPTELGTHISSLLCQTCKGGTVVPEDPLDEQSCWSCTRKCGFRIEHDCLQIIVKGINEQAEELNYDDFAGLEEFIAQWSRFLHPNNSILLGIKYYLTQFYGSAPGFHLDELAIPLLRRKIQLCQDLLKITQVLEPGSSKLREFLLTELEPAEKELARRPKLRTKPAGKKSSTAKKSTAKKCTVKMASTPARSALPETEVCGSS